ncbi:MAG: glycosyltransferase [Betaproteobacteria bacterium]
MKFALITTNLRGGGAEKAMIKFAALLAKRGHETHLILLEHIVEHQVPEGVRLSALTPPGKNASKGFFGKLILALRLKSLVKQLSGAKAFDLILTTLPFADEVSQLARLPRLWHRVANTLSAEIDMLAQGNPGKAARRRKKYFRMYDHSRLITVSDGVAEDLKRMGISAECIERIYNPFDAVSIQRQARELTQLPEGPYILHIGRFSPQKRHDLLFRALRKLPSSHALVLLCHDDPVLRALIAESELEDRVVVAGFQTNPYPWIAHADLLVLCSDHEGMPNVLVEALLLGTPVVSTDCPSGPRELLEAGRYGRLVPCGDPVALATAIKETLNGEYESPPFEATPYSPITVIEHLELLAARNY